MRIFTNFDIWNISKHRIKLGKVIYGYNKWNLDEPNQQLKLIEHLIRDNVIQSLDKSINGVSLKNIAKYHFKFALDEIYIYNQKLDGSQNRMQYLTVIANLKQTNLFKSI